MFDINKIIAAMLTIAWANTYNSNAGSVYEKTILDKYNSFKEGLTEAK